MSIHKHFGMLALTMALAAGCSGPDPNDAPTADVQQAMGGFYSSNGWTPYYTDTSITHIVPTLGWMKSPIRGINLVNGYIGRPASQHAYWYLMDYNNDYAAVIDSMSCGGTPVSNYQWNTVTFNNGYFYVQLYANGVTGSPIQVFQPSGRYRGSYCAGPLNMHVGAPYNGTIQITPTGLSTPGQLYTAIFVPDGGLLPPQPSQQYMDPIVTWSAVDSNGNLIIDSNPSNGYLVPIPGVTWDMDSGNPTSNSGYITFASSNDAVGTCLAWGYDPIANSTLHQVCTRLKRADFCGDGGSWTTASGTFGGNQVMLWDNGGTVHANPGMPINLTEALWISSGAICVNTNALRAANAGQLIKYNAQGNPVSSPFDPNSSCFSQIGSAYVPRSLPTCTTFSTTWNMASSASCVTWSQDGTQCLTTTNTLQ